MSNPGGDTFYTAMRLLLGLMLLDLLATGIPNTHGLQWLRFDVPRWVVEGDTVQLTCQFDVEADLLYSVKWYKQGKEFYRYVPAENRTKIAYPLPGVIVDEYRSDAKQVVLKSVRRSSAGRYKCEVLTESPLFKTLVKSDEMGVVQLPSGPPIVTGGFATYSPGNNVSLNCTSPHSYPASEITWYINGEKAPRDHLHSYSPTIDPRKGISSRVGLHFIAHRFHFPGGEMRLKCTATVHHYVKETHHLGVVSPPYHGHLFRGNNDACRLNTDILFVPLLLLLLNV